MSCGNSVAEIGHKICMIEIHKAIYKTKSGKQFPKTLTFDLANMMCKIGDDPPFPITKSEFQGFINHNGMSYCGGELLIRAERGSA